ncbi:MAG: hypothetical protein Q9227_007460 [Pyrenula ochraceoflavens]
MREPTREATPCPEVHRTSPRRSLISSNGNDTVDLDFTTEFRHSLRAAAQRRRSTNIRARPAGGLSFNIHEDEEVKANPHARVKAARNLTGRPSIMAQPAQRFKPGMGLASCVENDRKNIAAPQKPQSSHEIQARPAAWTTARVDKLNRPARRGTIYVPSEDTTMPSVFMGVFSPIKNFSIQQTSPFSQKEADMTGIAAQMAQKRAPRKSLAAAPPKRAPLHNPLRPIQETVGSCDIPGRKTGKENIPPGLVNVVDKATKVDEEDDPSLFNVGRTRSTHIRQSTMFSQRPVNRTSILPDALDRGKPKTNQIAVNDDPQSIATVCAPPRKSVAPGKWTTSLARAGVSLKEPRPQKITLSSGIPLEPKAPKIPLANGGYELFSETRAQKPPEKPPTKITIPAVPAVTSAQNLQIYPRIAEDIQNPSMYEDNWLSHQEIAITQLVNNLFSQSTTSGSHQAHPLQPALLELYQSESFSLLHKRLQASILYGALSIPQDQLKRATRLRDDLGVRKAFLDLWLKTYHPSYLKAAAEVVIGRQCPKSQSLSPRSSRLGSSPRSTCSPKGTRQTLAAFLETFLVRNEDVQHPETQAAAWSYRRVLHRSLLLIRLLDVAKRSDGVLPLPLFLGLSAHKSSTTVLHSLAAILIPSIGDIVRPLMHLDYTVSHMQYPLEEYNYPIENLATDLRDGVRLTRLVELLLYPSSSRVLERVNDTEATTALAMPTGEVLSLVEGEHDWPLSQHLRFPCLGRAPKLFNVQIALSALSEVRGNGTILDGIKAEDIVDGYREKTVKLLWSLVGKWGMEGLIDLEDLKQELGRLHRHCMKYPAVEDEEWDDPFDDMKGLLRHRHVLREWASAVCLPQGIPVDNLSTSFCDGRIFTAIVDAYAPFLAMGTRSRLQQNISLDSKLQSLGCNAQFCSLFALNDSKVFDRDTTLAALAFLASRLLAPSRRARAASTIQKAWRGTTARRMTRKMIVCRRLATECARVVTMKEKVCWAKEVLWSAWKASKLRRRDRHAGSDEKATGDETEDIWLRL